MNPTRPSLSLTVLLLSVPHASGQVVAKDQLVGWSSAPAITNVGEIMMQDAESGCQRARGVCSRILVHNAQNGHAGGTAYDSTRQAVWVSDGTTIAVVSLPGCKTLCTFKASLMNAKAVVSGLAISESRRRLYQLESTHGYAGLRSYDIRACPPVVLRDGCTFTIGSTSTAGGLAYDGIRDLLYITESYPAFYGYITDLHVAKAGDKCKPICKVGFPSCANSARAWFAVTGLAYSSCTNRLYATDGQMTSIATVTDPLKCQLTRVSCCDRQLPSQYRGLAVVPGWSQKTVGSSCLPRGCRTCSSMASRLVSEPSLGNPAFAFEIGGGPSGNSALLILGAGCGGGLKVPVLCGPLYPLLLPAPILSPPVLLAGGACTGVGRTSLPIPLVRALCGIQLCAQWIVFCGPSFGVSDAIEFTISGT